MSTPNRNLPLPEGTDLIQQGDNIISDISAKLDSAVTLLTGNLSARPSSAPQGTLYYATDAESYTVYVAGAWLPLTDGPPIGTVQHFAGASISDPRWLFAEGQAVSRATYAKLYAALGGSSSPWGQGNGTSTFNVPDLRGRSIIGSGTGSGLSARALGDAGGSETATAPLPAHSHGVTDPGHQHGGETYGAGHHSHSLGIAGGHTHQYASYAWAQVWGYTGPEAPGGPNYMIRGPWHGEAATHAAGGHQHDVEATGTHSHGFATDFKATGISIQSAGSGSGSHNNMQPYAAMRPIIRAL